MKTRIFSESEIDQAAQVLHDGGLIAFPTETVYGLGAPLFSPSSIDAIFRVKKRPQDNPLIAHLSDLSQMEQVARSLPSAFHLLAKAFFPGPLTLVVEKAPKVPSIASAGLNTIAVRVPDHSLAQNLIDAFGGPLVAPSANLSGRPSSTSLHHVLEDFDGDIEGVLDGGDCQVGIESTVVDLVSFSQPTLLRPGGVSKEALEEVLGSEVALYTKGPKSSPGMRYRHYAPKVPVYLYIQKEPFESHLAQSVRPLILSTSIPNSSHLPLDAKTLYRNLRLADEKGYDEVVIYCDRQLDRGLQNRLEKVVENESNCPESVWRS